MNAINKTVEAIAAGQDRVLLVMATGTGKTYNTVIYAVALIYSKFIESN